MHDQPTATKPCRVCGTDLALAANRRSGRSDCAECHRRREGARRLADLEGSRRRAREYAHAHKAEAKARHAAWYERNREVVKQDTRERNLQKSYGISITDYERMAQEQEWACAVCRRERELVVDHCHDTGNVRALLCRQCNASAGQTGDSPKLLRALADYLERHAECLTDSQTDDDAVACVRATLRGLRPELAGDHDDREA